MEILDKKLFFAAFGRFNESLFTYNGSQFTSFDAGVPEEWESYKPIVRKIATGRLQAKKWSNSDIGSGKILDNLIDAIEIKEPNGIRNNLVPWEPRHNSQSETARLKDILEKKSVLQQFERNIFNLFNQIEEPDDVFADLVEIVGRRYSLIAYIYYLFDDTRFLPISTTTFDEAFDELGIQVRTTRQCSWENYDNYLCAVRSVRACLKEWIGVNDVTLIDAHSYLWLLVRLPQENQRRIRQGLRRPDDLKSGMIKLAQRVVNRVDHSNGQSIERHVKNKELLGFSANEMFYEFLCVLWQKQDGRCKLTGLPMLLPEKNLKTTEMVVSIDRIDSSDHYKADNIQLTCWFANRWKGTQPDADFEILLEIIRQGEHVKDKYPQHFGVQLE